MLAVGRTTLNWAWLCQIHRVFIIFILPIRLSNPHTPIVSLFRKGFAPRIHFAKITVVLKEERMVGLEKYCPQHRLVKDFAVQPYTTSLDHKS